MPELENYLHYRIVDVSSIKELARRWYPRVYFASPKKHGGHRALADIRESIEELRYYREAVFVPQPGPDTETARAIAAKYMRRSTEALSGDRPPSRLGGTRTTSRSRGRRGRMVGVAQLVEHLVVVQDVAGSSPVTHPTGALPADAAGHQARADQRR